MKRIIIARHGHYDEDHNLSALGRDQMKALGEAVKDMLNGDSLHIASSTAPRARQSAEVLTEVFGIGFERYDFLWSGSDSPVRGRKYDSILALIRAVNVDVVLLVTHFEYSEELPMYLAEHLLQTSGHRFPVRHTEKGQAWVIDCEAKTCVLLAPAC